MKIQLVIHRGPAKCDLVPKDEQNKILLEGDSQNLRLGHIS